jgi:hypothetical protein
VASLFVPMPENNLDKELKVSFLFITIQAFFKRLVESRVAKGEIPVLDLSALRVELFKSFYLEERFDLN